MLEIFKTNNFIIYFLCEIFFVFAVALNFLCFKKRRLSDFITGGVFFLNSVVLASMLLFGSDFNISFREHFIFNNTTVLLKLLVNLFLFGFVLITYKIIRKAKFKAPIANSTLIMIGLVGSLLVQTQSFAISYLLFELSLFLIYSYASDMRLRKTGPYSSSFILISGSATALFIAFYLMTCSIEDSVQLNIIKICMTCALFLKAGFFPITNYIVNRNYRINIPHSLLLYSYLPFLGMIVFGRLFELISLTNEIYRVCVLLFSVLTMLSFSIYAFGAKNIIKFLAYSTNFLFGVCVLSTLFAPDSFLGIKLSVLVMFLNLAIYSLICILKINLNPDKMNISILKGIFINNRFFAALASYLFLALNFLIPPALLKDLYLFDKFGAVVVFVVALCNILILYNVFNIIKSIYEIDRKNMVKKLTKRTTLNYVVPVVVIICLAINLFL